MGIVGNDPKTGSKILLTREKIVGKLGYARKNVVPEAANAI